MWKLPHIMGIFAQPIEKVGTVWSTESRVNFHYSLRSVQRSYPADYTVH